ncbi:MAG: glutathione S-transferase [Pseudobdellovibrio sp.]
MITVHHLNNSRSQRILWLLEEMQLPYEIVFYHRDPKTMLAPESLKKIHPLGKSPVVTDGDVVMAESAAIIQYLLEKYKSMSLKPKADTPEALKYLYWMNYAEGSAMFPLLLTLIFSKIAKSPAPFFIKPILKSISNKVMQSYINPQVKLHLDFMESELNKAKWFAGSEFSAADIQMSFPIEAAAARGGLDQSRPHLAKFLETIQARPAYKKALEKGGPYNLLS